MTYDEFEKALYNRVREGFDARGNEPIRITREELRIMSDQALEDWANNRARELAKLGFLMSIPSARIWMTSVRPPLTLDVSNLRFMGRRFEVMP